MHGIPICYKHPCSHKRGGGRSFLLNECIYLVQEIATCVDFVEDLSVASYDVDVIPERCNNEIVTELREWTI